MKEVTKKDDGMDKYEVEHAARTLMEAEEIKGNEALLKKVMSHLKAKKKAISSVEGLRKKAKEMRGEE